MNKFFNKAIDNVNSVRIAFVLVLVLGLFCLFLQIKNNKTVETLQSSYSRALYDLVDYMDNVETLLAKAQISNSSEFSAKTLTEIWRKADLAQSSLSQIPITHISLEKVLQYLNQLSDYSYSLSKKTIEGEKLSEEDFKNLKELHERSKIMNQTLVEIVLDINNGGLSWSELTKEIENSEFAQEVTNISQDSFGKIEENMQDYTGLIYDGPFSEHMTSSKPLGLGSGEVDNKKAEEIIYQYIYKDAVANITYDGISDANIPVHNFTLNLTNGTTSYFDVSTQGGKVVWFMNTRIPEREEISVEYAKTLAKDYLNRQGIKNMKETYYIKQNSCITINFAYEQDDVICYPDLIKVKVALDNGEILGIEAQSYYSCHTERKLVKPKITLEEARSKINPNLEIMSAGIAVIPTDFKTEILTYEFKGKVEENEFLIYINVEDGHEEEIFMIIDTPNGVLTV